MSKEISRDYLLNFFRYENGNLIRLKSNTRADLIGKCIGTIRPDGYIKSMVNGSYYYLHRLIWVFHNGYIESEYEVDHVNGNPSDNRIENLRLSLPFQNCQNLKKSHFDSETGVLGVTYNKRQNSFVVQIKRKNKRIVKYFKSIKDAEVFYLKTKREIHEYNTL